MNGMQLYVPVTGVRSDSGYGSLARPTPDTLNFDNFDDPKVQ